MQTQTNKKQKAPHGGALKVSGFNKNLIVFSEIPRAFQRIFL